MTSSGHPPDPPKRAVSERARFLSYLLDNSIPIPGTNLRIGLDALLGLIPGLGDALGGLLAGFIVYEGYRLGLPKATLLRMLFNLALDSALGSIPGIGDVFDAAFKANVRNYALLERHAAASETSPRRDVWFLVLLIAGIALFAGAMFYLGFRLFELIMQQLA